MSCIQAWSCLRNGFSFIVGRGSMYKGYRGRGKKRPARELCQRRIFLGPSFSFLGNDQVGYGLLTIGTKNSLGDYSS